MEFCPTRCSKPSTRRSATPYDEPDKHGVEDSPEWKEWRDTVEGEMTKRGLEFEHIVLAGEEEEESEGADEDDDKDE